MLVIALASFKKLTLINILQTKTKIYVVN